VGNGWLGTNQDQLGFSTFILTQLEFVENPFLSFSGGPFCARASPVSAANAIATGSNALRILVLSMADLLLLPNLSIGAC
jgi:hypothetical protein